MAQKLLKKPSIFYRKLFSNLENDHETPLVIKINKVQYILVLTKHICHVPTKVLKAALTYNPATTTTMAQAPFCMHCSEGSRSEVL